MILNPFEWSNTTPLLRARAADTEPQDQESLFYYWCKIIPVEILEKVSFPREIIREMLRCLKGGREREAIAIVLGFQFD